MKHLIFSQDNSIEPRGTIGIQKCGINFWQKAQENHEDLRLPAVATWIGEGFSPTNIQQYEDCCYIQFDNETSKTIYLMLKEDPHSKKLLLYGEVHTVYAGADFHLFALEVVEYIATRSNCSFFVDDATEYVTHRSVEKLKKYIEDFDIQPVASPDLLRQAIIAKQNRT